VPAFEAPRSLVPAFEAPRSLVPAFEAPRSLVPAFEAHFFGLGYLCYSITSLPFILLVNF
jgi:hypothetical protein